MNHRFLKEITPALFRISQGADHFLFRLFGLIFVLPGLFVMALAFGYIPMDEGPPPLWGPGAILIGMGFFFTVMGLWLVLRRHIVEIDLRKRQIIFIKAPFPWRRHTETLSFDDILRIEIHTEPDGRTTWYQLLARNKNEWPFQLFSSPRLAYTSSLAAELARNTGIAVMDFTTSDPRSLSLAELQIPHGADEDDEAAGSEFVAIDDTRFREIHSRDASVKLFHCEYRGVNAFKAVYAKPYMQRLFICAFLLFINYQFTGFKYAEIIQEIQQPDRALFSVLFLGVLILLTVILPWLSLLKTALAAPHRAMIQMRGDFVSVFDMGPGTSRDKRFRIDTEIKRGDILAVSARAAAPGTWKIAKSMNCLELRSKTALLSCFQGMNADHLEIVKNALLKFIQKN